VLKKTTKSLLVFILLVIFYYCFVIIIISYYISARYLQLYTQNKNYSKVYRVAAFMWMQFTVYDVISYTKRYVI